VLRRLRRGFAVAGALALAGTGLCQAL
jgi:hypothetical protein